MTKSRFLWPWFVVPVFAVFFLSGCASVPDDPEEKREYEVRNDPMEPLNRKIFAFNEGLDKMIFRPLALGYLQVPEYGRDRIHNVIVNVRAPVHFGNAILQGDIPSIGNILGRFLVNTTIGLGGMYDVATAIGIKDVNTDFGITLARYGFDEGPYLVMPVLGPGMVRSLVGRGADTFLDPLTYVYNGQDMDPEAGIIQAAITGIDLRARLFGPIEDIRENSIDHYAAVRSYYRQERRRQVRSGGDDDGDIDFEGYDVLGPTVFDDRPVPRSDKDGDDGRGDMVSILDRSYSDRHSRVHSRAHFSATGFFGDHTDTTSDRRSDTAFGQKSNPKNDADAKPMSVAASGFDENMMWGIPPRDIGDISANLYPADARFFFRSDRKSPDRAFDDVSDDVSGGAGTTWQKMGSAGDPVSWPKGYSP